MKVTPPTRNKDGDDYVTLHNIDYIDRHITLDGVRWDYHVYLPADVSTPTNAYGTIGDIARVRQNRNQEGETEEEEAFWVREIRKWVKADEKLDNVGKPCQKHPLLKGRYRLDKKTAKWRNVSAYYMLTKAKRLVAGAAGISNSEVAGRVGRAMKGEWDQQECVSCSFKKEPIHIDLTDENSESWMRAGRSSREGERRIFVDLSSEENWRARGITLTLPQASSSTVPPLNAALPIQEPAPTTSTTHPTTSSSKPLESSLDGFPSNKNHLFITSLSELHTEHRTIDDEDTFIIPPEEELQYPQFSSSQSQPQPQPQSHMASSHASLDILRGVSSAPTRSVLPIDASHTIPGLSSDSRLEAKLDSFFAQASKDRHDMLSMMKIMMQRIERLEAGNSHSDTTGRGPVQSALNMKWNGAKGSEATENQSTKASELRNASPHRMHDTSVKSVLSSRIESEGELDGEGDTDSSMASITLTDYCRAMENESEVVRGKKRQVDDTDFVALDDGPDRIKRKSRVVA